MISKLFAKLTGRTTAFCGAFFISGHVLAWLHRLDGTYIAFMVALLGAVIGHSVKEDIFPTLAGAPAVPQKDVKE